MTTESDGAMLASVPSATGPPGIQHQPCPAGHLVGPQRIDSGSSFGHAPSGALALEGFGEKDYGMDGFAACAVRDVLSA